MYPSVMMKVFANGNMKLEKRGGGDTLDLCIFEVPLYLEGIILLPNYKSDGC